MFKGAIVMKFCDIEMKYGSLWFLLCVWLHLNGGIQGLHVIEWQSGGEFTLCQFVWVVYLLVRDFFFLICIDGGLSMAIVNNTRTRQGACCV